MHTHIYIYIYITVFLARLAREYGIVSIILQSIFYKQRTASRPRCCLFTYTSTGYQLSRCVPRSYTPFYFNFLQLPEA